MLISREHNSIQIDLAAPCPLRTCLSGRCWGNAAPIRRIVFNRIDRMDSKIGFELSLSVVEAIRGRCASFMILTATVSEIFGGQTNSYILVL